MSTGAFLIAVVLIVGLIAIEKAVRKLSDRIDNNSQLLSEIKDKMD